MVNCLILIDARDQLFDLDAPYLSFIANFFLLDAHLQYSCPVAGIAAGPTSTIGGGKFIFLPRSARPYRPSLKWVSEIFWEINATDVSVATSSIECPSVRRVACFRGEMK